MVLNKVHMKKYAFIKKIHNFYPIITKLCQNEVLMRTSFDKVFYNFLNSKIDFLIDVNSDVKGALFKLNSKDFLSSNVF